MEELRHSCADAANFPENLRRHQNHKHTLNLYRKRLKDESTRLFGPSGEASLHVFHAKDWEDDFQHYELKNGPDLYDYLNSGSWAQTKELPCRFFFIHAPNSRSPLKVTHEMFVYLLSFYQVLPSFLDFVFPFGEQLYKQDAYFGGLSYQHALGQPFADLPIDQLSRSGIRCQQTYSLKSIEASKWQPNWPWVVRQTSIYHSFDLKEAISTWIIIKANTIIRDRFADNLDRQLMTPKQPARAFPLALQCHLIPCEWAGEEWRWYLEYVESRLQKLTSTSLTADLRQNVDPAPDPTLQRRSTWQTFLSNFTQSDTKSKSSSSRRLSRWFSWPSTAPCEESADVELGQRTPQEPSNKEDIYSFKFKHLQELQYIEENINEARHVLLTNSSTVASLSDYLQSLWNHHEFPPEIKSGCLTEFVEFIGRLKTIQQGFSGHLQSIDSINRLLLQRKDLVHGLLTYRMAEQSQASAQNVERITETMSGISKRTERATINMKIISVVTLTFLPMTFIAKTLMNTDIVHFDSDDGLSHRKFSPGALQLFILLSLPLMLVTVIVWRILNKRAETRINEQQQAHASQHV